MTDENRLLLGAGTLLGSALAVTIAAGILFAGSIGVSLSALAFPENRLDLPVETLFETGRTHDDTITERL